MSYKKFLIVSFAGLVLGGCGSMPSTPDLMIENAKSGAMMTEKDLFEVKRPLAEVSAVLKNKSEECLNRKIEVKWRQNGLDRREVSALKSKFEAGKKRSRLTLQRKTIEGATELGDIPPDGWYIMVVDAYPVDKSTTRIERYFQHHSYKGAFTAIKPWLTGTNMGCPDLTQ